MSRDFATLMRDARRGDAAAIEELMERHLPGLRAYVRLNTGELIRAKESCSDLVQSVCREVLVDLDGFGSENEIAFRQWLYTIALHKILDRKRYYQAGKREAARESPLGTSTNSEGQLLDAYGALTTPSREAEAREEVARIEAVFDRLPEDYREVIVLARLVGLSRPEIARRLGRTEEAVRRLLNRARARLANLLDG